LIESGKRHRVQSTSPTEPTVWLAVHWKAIDAAPRILTNTYATG
jgi:hypothetical protein